MKQEIVFAKADHLDSIIKIWGTNRATLGLMPKDAFIEALKKRWILVALIDEFVVGYLLFRHTVRNQTLAITHLCVDKPFRGQNLSDKLIDKLVEKYRYKARGIKLNCRSDYTDAIKFWNRYNFQPKAELPSRSSNTNVYLITWWYSFGSQDLFSLITNDKIKAVLDFNIIAKLRDLQLDNSKEEVAHLQADWLASEVEYYRASETINELFRDSNTERSTRTKAFLKNFAELDIDKYSLKPIEKELEDILVGDSVNDRSDRRQVAEAVLSGFPYFVTMDDGILKQAKAISNTYQLKVVTPSTLISEIDLAINAEDYNPRKLSAQNFTITKLKPDERKKVEEAFLSHGTGEKKSSLSTKIGNTSSSPSGRLTTINDGKDTVGVYGTYELDDSLYVTLIRTKQYALRQTIFIQNINDLINEALTKKKSFLVVADEHLTEIEQNILLASGFFKNDGQFVRGIKQGIIPHEVLKSSLEMITNRIPDIKKLTETTCDQTAEGSFLSAVTLEKLLWPIKLKDSEIPCFIVPIKPYYAKSLFDTKAAKMELFGVEPKLIWSNENVYYRNVNPNVEEFPARVLWYASADQTSPRQKAVVCSSSLDEVVIGPAKTLFKKFEKFGVYRWEKDIKPLCKGEASKNIKVLRFSDSEPFINVVSLVTLKRILRRNGESDNNFQSPLRIKTSTFMEIYALGTGLDYSNE